MSRGTLRFVRMLSVSKWDVYNCIILTYFNLNLRHWSFVWISEISFGWTWRKSDLSKFQNLSKSVFKSILKELIFVLVVIDWMSESQQWTNAMLLWSQILLVVGGRNNNVIHGKVECYDFETERWCLLAVMPTGKSGYTHNHVLIKYFWIIFVFIIWAPVLVSVNGRIYAICGTDWTIHVWTVDSYDLNLNR